MKVKITERERAELLKMWKSGEVDLDKLPSLKPYIPRCKPMTDEEAKRIIKTLNL